MRPNGLLHGGGRRLLWTRRLGPPPPVASLAVTLLALACGAGVARAASPSIPDSGAFKVYQGGVPIGIETFNYLVDADSMLVSAHTRLILPTAKTDTLFKDAGLVVSVADYEPRQYKSEQHYVGESMVLGIATGDTAMTLYRQYGLKGDAVRVVRPPGKIYIIDPLLYTMFDVIARDLHGRTFDQRTLQLLVLAAPEAVIEATARDRGEETIRWGAKPVTTRKVEISDGRLDFNLWISPTGQMLKLEESASGLRVVREPPPVKRRKPIGD